MEWGEAVEALANAVIDSRITADSGDLRRTSEFLAHRILCSLQAQMKKEKKVPYITLFFLKGLSESNIA